MAVSLGFPRFQAFTDAGDPAVGWKLYTYAAGTTTPIATYTTAAGTTPNANPVVLNARGEATIYFTAGTAYKLVLKTAADVTVWTEDNVTIDPSSDASMVGFLQSGSGAVPREAQSKMREIFSISDFGGVGDGTTNNNTAETNAEAATTSGGVYVPAGAFKDTRLHFSPTKRYFGDGYTVDSNGRKRARFFSQVTAVPAGGNTDGFDTIFNGDWSNVPFPIYHRVTGNTTAWRTGGTYNQIPEITPFFCYMRNESGAGGGAPVGTGVGVTAGWIKVTGASTDPSATIALTLQGTQNTAVAGGTPVISNNQNALVLLTGQADCNVDGIFLNTVEIDSNDNGKDVACIGYNNRLTRFNSTGAGGAFWCGYRAASEGTQRVDYLFAGLGLANYGLDFTQANFGPNQAAVALAPDQKIYYAATPGSLPASASSPGTVATSYDSSTSRWIVWFGATAALQVQSNSIWLPTGASMKIGGIDVVKNRINGWVAATGTKSRATFATDTATTADVAQRLGQLIDDLISHGLIGV
jgi:hypothetical protein